MNFTITITKTKTTERENNHKIKKILEKLL